MKGFIEGYVRRSSSQKWILLKEEVLKSDFAEDMKRRVLSKAVSKEEDLKSDFLVFGSC